MSFATTREFISRHKGYALAILAALLLTSGFAIARTPQAVEAADFITEEANGWEGEGTCFTCNREPAPINGVTRPDCARYVLVAESWRGTRQFFGYNMGPNCSSLNEEGKPFPRKQETLETQWFQTQHGGYAREKGGKIIGFVIAQPGLSDKVAVEDLLTAYP